MMEIRYCFPFFIPSAIVSPGESDYLTWKERLYSFFCGLTPSSDSTLEVDSTKQEEEREQSLEKVLEQPQNERWLLLGLLVVILSIGVFLLIFWSTWKYTPRPGLLFNVTSS